MRREDVVACPLEGRDKGKKFHIREMSAVQAEKWAMRALLAVARSGVDVPDELKQGGMAAMAFLGLRMLSHVDWREAEPLLDEMLACAQMQEAAARRPLTEDDVDEPQTLFWLRNEVFKLHTGFSFADAALASAAKINQIDRLASQTSPTSPASSEASSPPGSQPSGS